ncbi:MAG: Fe-S cluster assembly ATPase SufC [Proteobacteria bacterium]|nr:MAG: Fe-S cluster assembly ATPase SufC [Pseudomonadota bacterium]
MNGDRATKGGSPFVLEISGLRAGIEGKEIIRGLDLKIKPGEIHAIMGPNGSGKSTLAKVLAGHPHYEVTAGTVQFDGQELGELEPDERARKGLFMAFQYPHEIPGVSILNFLRTALNSRLEKEMPVMEFRKLLYEKMDQLGMDHSFATRFVNDGFSGGEKKRNEILQMAILRPKLAVLDETDSGLDIDALKIVAGGVNSIMQQSKGETSTLIITHYNRILDYLKPNYVHILHQGKIVRSGQADLARELEAQGYDRVVQQSASH